MEIKIKLEKHTSNKTGKPYLVLVVNDVYVCFDIRVIARVFDLSPSVISRYLEGADRVVEEV